MNKQTKALLKQAAYYIKRAEFEKQSAFKGKDMAKAWEGVGKAWEAGVEGAKSLGKTIGEGIKRLGGKYDDAKKAAQPWKLEEPKVEVTEPVKPVSYMDLPVEQRYDMPLSYSITGNPVLSEQAQRRVISQLYDDPTFSHPDFYRESDGVFDYIPNPPSTWIGYRDPLIYNKNDWRRYDAFKNGYDKTKPISSMSTTAIPGEYVGSPRPELSLYGNNTAGILPRRDSEFLDSYTKSLLRPDILDTDHSIYGNRSSRERDALWDYESLVKDYRGLSDNSVLKSPSFRMFDSPEMKDAFIDYRNRAVHDYLYDRAHSIEDALSSNTLYNMLRRGVNRFLSNRETMLPYDEQLAQTYDELKSYKDITDRYGIPPIDRRGFDLFGIANNNPYQQIYDPLFRRLNPGESPYDVYRGLMGDTEVPPEMKYNEWRYNLRNKK